MLWSNEAAPHLRENASHPYIWYSTSHVASSLFVYFASCPESCELLVGNGYILFLSVFQVSLRLIPGSKKMFNKCLLNEWMFPIYWAKTHLYFIAYKNREIKENLFSL